MNEQLVKDSSIPVFVYGSLKRGFANHGYLKEATMVGDGFTKDHFVMVSFGGFPGLVRDGDRGKPMPVYGEVYRCTPDELARLDRLESNGYFYQREVVNIQGQSHNTPAWVYILLDQSDGHNFDTESCEGTEYWDWR